jgi:hypothetical protein
VGHRRGQTCLIFHQAAESIEGPGCGNQVGINVMGKSEFAVKEDAYPADNGFFASLCSGFHDRAIWEGDIDSIGYSILVGMVEI